MRGIPIRVHWSLLVAAVYIALGASQRLAAVADLAGVDAAQMVLPAPVWGVLLAVALFGSIALHELAHAIVALRYGGSIRAITLMIAGGVSELAHAPERPAHEAVMALAGPACSFALFACCIALAAVLGDVSPDAQVALFYLGAANLTLGLFNLVPAFPMDGGRVLRAALAARVGRARATQIAVRIGKICAFGFGLLALAGASWTFAAVALFVYVGAAAEGAGEILRESLRGLHIADLLPATSARPVILFDERVGSALARMRELERTDLIVIDRYGRPIGVLDADAVRRAEGRGQDALDVEALVWPRPADHIVVSADTDANEAIELATGVRANRVVVVDPPSGEVLGVVEPTDIARVGALGA